MKILSESVLGSIRRNTGALIMRLGAEKGCVLTSTEQNCEGEPSFIKIKRISTKALARIKEAIFGE
jgi:hypothetical protein